MLIFLSSTEVIMTNCFSIKLSNMLILILYCLYVIISS